MNDLFEKYHIYFEESASAFFLNLMRRRYKNTRILFLFDENTYKHSYPKLKVLVNQLVARKYFLVIKAGEKNKNINEAQKIWSFMLDNDFHRDDLLVNIGGGMICDLGGFAASTFKRGMDYINIPTTTMAQIDAAYGGKTAVNFKAYKNQIGLFKHPKAILMFFSVLETLDRRQWHAGAFEAFKHMCLSGKQKVQNFDFKELTFKDAYMEMLKQAVAYKCVVVSKDAEDRDARQVLNFGHTIGHALEAYFLYTEKPLLHGESIALGMIAEAFLSKKLLGFPQNQFDLLKHKVLESLSAQIFDDFNLDVNQVEKFLYVDKKIKNNELVFILLEKFGKPLLKKNVSAPLLKECLLEIKQLYATDRN